jgi:hypothetical protein
MRETKKNPKPEDSRLKKPFGLKLPVMMALASLAIIIIWNPLHDGVDAQTMVANVTIRISNVPPTVMDMQCCFKNSGDPGYDMLDCRLGGSGNPYVITGGVNYDILCNFTIKDSNGWQDMIDGWVNATWHRESVSHDSPRDYDTLYAVDSCANISFTDGGMEVVYECEFEDIRYWADGGNWNLTVRFSDGETTPQINHTTILMANVTSIWQSSIIDFGAMSPGDLGSQYYEGMVGVHAITNNTGNTIIDLEVSGGSEIMDCTIGEIPITNIRYDRLQYAGYWDACGTLKSYGDWDCDPINLQDCHADCPGTISTANTYWGIRIPETGIGGACHRQILFMGVQANP